MITEAPLYPEGTIQKNIKQPGRTLTLFVRDQAGGELGTIALERVESQDISTLSFESRRGNAIKFMNITGSFGEPIELKRKRGARSFNRQKADFIIELTGPATHLYDPESKRSYLSLHVMLSAS